VADLMRTGQTGAISSARWRDGGRGFAAFAAQEHRSAVSQVCPGCPANAQGFIPSPPSAIPSGALSTVEDWGEANNFVITRKPCVAVAGWSWYAARLERKTCPYSSSRRLALERNAEPLSEGVIDYSHLRSDHKKFGQGLQGALAQGGLIPSAGSCELRPGGYCDARGCFRFPVQEWKRYRAGS